MVIIGFCIGAAFIGLAAVLHLRDALNRIDRESIGPRARLDSRYVGNR